MMRIGRTGHTQSRTRRTSAVVMIIVPWFAVAMVCNSIHTSHAWLTSVVTPIRAPTSTHHLPMCSLTTKKHNEVASESRLQDRQQHRQKLRYPQSRSSSQSASLFVALSIMLASFGAPLPAQAGFGPSGGATTTPAPGIQQVNVNNMSQKKLQQLIQNSLDESRLVDLRAQLDSLIESITNARTSETEDPDSAPSNLETTGSNYKIIPTPFNVGQEARIDVANNFRQQISAREALLNKLEAQPAWFNYLAAFCGSVSSTLVMHPLDTIKTRLQVQSSNETNSSSEQGPFTNLYEGLLGNIFKEGPPSAVYLGVYESVKYSLMHGKLGMIYSSLWGVTSAASASISSNPTFLLSIYLTAGAAGELMGSTLRAPAESVKSLVQTQTASSSTEAIQKIFQDSEGRANLIRTWSAVLLRDVPFGAIQLALFEIIKAYILNNPNIDYDASTLQSEAIIGACAGAFGAFVTNPSDVIVARIITQGNDSRDPLDYWGMANVIYEEGGLKIFFTGWQARILYWGPAISIFLTCYCSVRQIGVSLDWFN